MPILTIEQKNSYDSHVVDKNNPHDVSHIQLSDRGTNTHDEIDAHIALVVNHIAQAIIDSDTKSAVTLANKVITEVEETLLSDNIETHKNKTDNPHMVTHSQLSDKGVNTHSQIDTHIANTLSHITNALIDSDTMSPVDVGNKILTEVENLLLENNINTHKGRTDNPHTVTHSQLSDKGTNTHEQIDSHLSIVAAHLLLALVDSDTKTAVTAGNKILTEAEETILEDNINNHKASTLNPHSVTYSQLPDVPDLTVKLEWKNKWQSVTYAKNSMVIDGAYFGITNKDNVTDRLAPAKVGLPFYIYDGTSTDLDNTANKILFGGRYRFATASEIINYKINVYAGVSYDIYMVEDPEGTPVSTFIETIVATESGLKSISYPSKIMLAGSTIDFYAITQNEVTPLVIQTKYEMDYNVPYTNNGFYIADDVYANITIDNHYYGIDLEIQEISPSSDWDIILSNAHLSSGGAESTGSGLPSELDKDFMNITTEGIVGDSAWSPFMITPKLISQNYTIKAGSSATIANPVIEDAFTITIEDGATLVIL